MNFSSLVRQPIVWLIGAVLALVLVLAIWHVTRPTDAEGNSLILSNREVRDLKRDLGQQAARRAQDSLRATQATAAATDLYRRGRQAADSATRLHQRTHEKPAAADTAAGQLQRELSNY